MSIAVSAIVSPSRALRALLAAYGLASLAAGLAVGIVTPGRFHLPLLSSLAFALAGAALLLCRSRLTKTRRIDISGVGQLRLTVQQDIRTSSAHGGNGAPQQDAGEPVALADGSTVWSRLMLLRLRAGNGTVVHLPILPDSVAPGEFRALAVALRAASERNKPIQGQDKIL